MFLTWWFAYHKQINILEYYNIIWCSRPQPDKYLVRREISLWFGHGLNDSDDVTAHTMHKDKECCQNGIGPLFGPNRVSLFGPIRGHPHNFQPACSPMHGASWFVQIGSPIWTILFCQNCPHWNMLTLQSVEYWMKDHWECHSSNLLKKLPKDIFQNNNKEDGQFMCGFLSHAYISSEKRSG